MTDRAQPGWLRDVRVDDLLGRQTADDDLGDDAEYLAGKRVLVTGAGGSIGSELCRQVRRWAPEEVIMLDHDESALLTTQLAVYQRPQLDGQDVVLADVRDRQALLDAFTSWRPHIVLHAAALKHVVTLERHPAEAFKTNVLGTRNVLEAAAAANVERFVNISTDKAADPAGVLGYSKRIAEGLTAQLAMTTGRHYLSVRFGNVLGSRGAVLTTFLTQIAEGRPVTVTSPEVTRYFMSAQEAVQLVIRAGAIGGPGEVLILDMGEPVKVVDLARKVLDQAGVENRIEFIGLKPGEKVTEVLFGAGEHDHRPAHPRISHVQVPPVDLARYGPMDPSASSSLIVAHMLRICTDMAERTVAARPLTSVQENTSGVGL